MKVASRLIVNSDDGFYSERRDIGISKAFQKGRVTDVSLMMNGEVAQKLLQLDSTLQRKGISSLYKVITELRNPVGLHLNLTEGHSIMASREIPSLIGTSGMYGKLGFRKAFSAGKITKEEIKREVEAQMILFHKLFGYYPSHLDGHQHVHIMNGIDRIIAHEIALKGVVFTRLPLEDLDHVTWAKIDDFSSTVLADSIRAKGVFQEYNIRFPDHFVGLLNMSENFTAPKLEHQIRYQLEKQRCTNIDTSYQPIIELMTHPGLICTDEDLGCGTGADDFSKSVHRERELDFLLSDKFSELVSTMGHSLVSFSDLK